MEFSKYQQVCLIYFFLFLFFSLSLIRIYTKISTSREIALVSRHSDDTHGGEAGSVFIIVNDDGGGSLAAENFVQIVGKKAFHIFKMSMKLFACIFILCNNHLWQSIH